MQIKKALIVSRTQLAALCGTTPDRVSKWIAEGLPGVVETGGGRGRPTRLDLALALPWLLGRRNSESARDRYYEAQAARVELETLARRGSLVEVAEVERQFADLAQTVKARLRALPNAIAVLMCDAAKRGPGAVQAQLLTAIDEALLELSRRIGESS